MLKQFMPYVNLLLICRHLYTSLPRSRIILIVMDGAILLRPLVRTLADGLMITDTDDGDPPVSTNCNHIGVATSLS